MAEARRSVIAGSRSFGAPLAALSTFLLAAMRRGVPLAMLVGWPCLIVDDNGSFLDAARVLFEPEGLSVVGFVSTVAEASNERRSSDRTWFSSTFVLGDETGLSSE